MKKGVLFLCFICFSLSILWADESPEPYQKDEFKPWMHELRRSEIITLGSLPFTTLTTSLGYSFYRYAAHNYDSDYIPNPFSPAQASLSVEEQKQILLISLSASLLVGIIDFTIRMVKKNKSKIALEQEEPPYTIIKNIIEDED